MSERAIVPCNGCRQCCRGEVVYLHPERGDDTSQYHTREVFNPMTNMMGLALMQRGNGDCFYLGVAGCTIHERAPAICRAFDCKAFYERLLDVFGAREIGIASRSNLVLQMGRTRSEGEKS